jgi:hypothetical protein
MKNDGRGHQPRPSFFCPRRMVRSRLFGKLASSFAIRYFSGLPKNLLNTSLPGC